MSNQLQYLSRARVTREGLLGKDEVAVERDLEDAAGRADHLDLRAGERLLQLSRQTDGSWLVVSDDAELDAYLHADPSLVKPGPPSRES